MKKLVFALVLLSALTASASTLRSASGGSFLSALIAWVFGSDQTRGGWGDGTPNNQARGGWGDGTNNNSN